MNRMKVFLLLAVMIGFSSCQSRSKQNIEQEVEVDSLSTNPTEEIKIITGVVKDASMNNFMLITLQGDTLFISTMDQEPNDVAGFELGDTVRVNYIEEEEEPGLNTIPTAQKVIVIGKKNGAYAATSESSSLPNLDYEIDRYVGPGEIIRMRADGLEQLRKPNEDMQICSFLWVYYGFPVSCYEGRNVEEVRFMSGYKMGKTDESEVDCACGIPDSGVGMALGYAEGKGIPYHRAIAKYTPTWPRSFTPSNQAMRSLVAKMKLIPNRAMLQGKRILFCDDSIVRGTQLRDNVNVLYDYGAKEVHMRIACPPLIYGCPFIGFTSSKSDMELITRRIIKEIEGDENAKLDKYATTDSPEYKELVERIRARFGLTSLKFNTLETLIEAIGLPKCKVCTHCFDGSSHF